MPHTPKAKAHAAAADSACADASFIEMETRYLEVVVANLQRALEGEDREELYYTCAELAAITMNGTSGVRQIAQEALDSMSPDTRQWFERQSRMRAHVVYPDSWDGVDPVPFDF